MECNNFWLKNDKKECLKDWQMYEMRMTINIDMFIINKKINWKSKQKAPVQVVD